MSKAQEVRDRAAANAAANAKALQEYAAREAVRDAAQVLIEASDAYDAMIGTDDEPATDREERIALAQFTKGENEGRAEALIDRADEDLRIIEDKIEWLRYRHPDTTMTTMEILEAMLAESKALR